MEKKITIITVTYNCEDTIKKTMKSVLNQKYKNYEYIIIDGKSKDSTLDKVFEIKNQYSEAKIIILSEKDKGIYDAMNKGIDVSTGEWIYFLNSGDYFYDDLVLENLVHKHIEADTDILYGDIVLTLPPDRKKIKKSKEIDLIRKGMVFYHQAVLVKSSLMKLKKFDLNYKICADYDFFYFQYKQNKKFKRIEMNIAFYDLSGISSNNIKKLIEEKYKILEKDINITEKVIMLLLLLKETIKLFLPKNIKKILQNNKNNKIFGTIK